MTDGVFPDRLTQLRARWEADPSSRIFLQLAEEYRHLGRVQDALAVLEKGLKEHPGYLSALVAKGRCHIELGEGEAARGVLERVVKQDATQMVANKLLVRAYLETGEPAKARERLDLYTLLNDSDPEIEELRRRIRQLESPVQPEAPEVFETPETPETLETPERSSAMDADPFSLEPPRKQPPPLPPVSQMSQMPQMPQTPPVSQNIFDLDPPAPPRRGGNDIFELELAPPPAAARPPQPSREDDPFALEPAPAPRAAAPAAPLPEPEEPGDALFPGLASRDSRRRYLDALGSEGLFAFDPPPAQAPVPMPVSTPMPVPAPPEPDPFSFEPPPPPVIDLASEPAPFSFEPAPAPAAPADEASWLDEAAAVSSFASGPVPVLPAEPYAPAPVEMETEVETQPTAEELWSDEAPAAEAEMETAMEIEPPPFDFAPEPPPFDAELPEPELEPEAESEPAATATLGELYLRQGYHAEAERIFQEVLEREPGNAAASAGLEQLAALGPRPAAPEVDARRLLVGYRPDAGLPADAEMRARKAFILNRYLERLRHGGQHDVS